MTSPEVAQVTTGLTVELVWHTNVHLWGWIGTWNVLYGFWFAAAGNTENSAIYNWIKLTVGKAVGLNIGNL